MIPEKTVAGTAQAASTREEVPSRVRHIPAAERQFQDFGWLKTYWLFSFGSYHDPENVNHGILRVVNDDVVAPGTGFDTHPHQEMEIVTLVLDGVITHKDSLHHKTVIRAGEIQRMTAGTGITHSEYNWGKVPVHFCQIWLLPREPHLPPGYDQRAFPVSEGGGGLVVLASGEGAGGISLNADATISRGVLETGRSVQVAGRPERRRFIYLIQGDLDISGRRLSQGDQLRLDADPPLTVVALTPAAFLLIDAADVI